MFALCLVILAAAMLTSGVLGLSMVVPFLVVITGIVIAWRITFDWIVPWFELPVGARKVVGLIIFLLIFKFVVAFVFLVFGMLFAGLILPVMPL